MKQFFLIVCSVFFAQTALIAEEHLFKGKHFIASYLDCNDEALRNVDELKKAFEDAAHHSGATVVDIKELVFPPDGLTMVILLSESHASIHTYPEYGACFVDLFTCGDQCSSKAFDEVLRKYLKPRKVKDCCLLRSDEIEMMW